jgi:hypothetical protein
MAQQNNGIKYLIAGIALIAAIFFFLSSREQQSGLAHYQKVFRMLVDGQAGAAEFVDWDNFSAFGINIGTTYAGFTRDVDKQAYVKSFVRQLSRVCHDIGGGYEKFGDWRLLRQDASAADVSCEYREKSKLLFLKYVFIDQKWKLRDLRWADDEQKAKE